MKSQREMSCHGNSKILAKVCQLFTLYGSTSQKPFCNYHVEVKLIIYDENLVVDIDFDR